MILQNLYIECTVQLTRCVFKKSLEKQAHKSMTEKNLYLPLKFADWERAGRYYIFY